MARGGHSGDRCGDRQSQAPSRRGTRTRCFWPEETTLTTQRVRARVADRDRCRCGAGRAASARHEDAGRPRRVRAGRGRCRRSGRCDAHGRPARRPCPAGRLGRGLVGHLPRIEAASPFSLTVVGYVGDYCGYITDAADYERQTCERSSARTGRPLRQGLVRRATAMLEGLAGWAVRPRAAVRPGYAEPEPQPAPRSGAVRQRTYRDSGRGAGSALGVCSGRYFSATIHALWSSSVAVTFDRSENLTSSPCSWPPARSADSSSSSSRSH